MAHTDENGEEAPARSKLAKKMNGSKYYTLQFTRHGATRMNNDDVSVDRLRGWINVPLSADGRAEAKRLAKEISSNPPDAIFCSDLCRAQETAEIVAKACGIKMEKPSKDFRPWDVGELAGQVAEKAVPILARYVEETPDKPLPGGESFNSFEQRFLGGLVKVFQKHSGVVLIVAHHRNERLLKGWEKAGWPSDGTIDKATFSKKGEPTGHCEIIRIPAAKLKAAAGAQRAGS